MKKNNNKIIVRMRGGLGNQMFQLSYAYILNIVFGGKRTIEMDVRSFKNYYRQFDVTDFTLDSNIYLANKHLMKYDFLFRVFDIYRYLHKKMTKKRIGDYNRFLYEKMGFLFCEVSSSIPNTLYQKNIYLFGYFQNADVIIPYRNQLFDLFTLEKSKCVKIQKYLALVQKDSLAISIRINENNKLEGLAETEDDYYIKALDYIVSQKPINQIIVFSNNLEVVKKKQWLRTCNINVIYVDGCSPCEQIEIMKKCSDFIISNSTFSWWGAFLGTTKSNGIIIAPERWYGSDNIKNTKMMMDNIIVIK